MRKRLLFIIGFKLTLLFFLSISIPLVGFGQNLVPNPSFEVFEVCPPYPGRIDFANGWNTPNNRTTDFYHRCASIESGVGVPQNLLGAQEPASGDGYAGLRAWIPIIKGNPYYREYLATQLLEPMEAGVHYEISFRVNVAEESGYISDDIGLYLSSTSLKQEDLYRFEPIIRQEPGLLLQNTEVWQTIEGPYLAKGGEQYLVIGNFLADEAMSRMEKDPTKPVVYYFIDDVSVESCANTQDTLIQIDTFLCPNNAIELKGIEGAKNYFWSNETSSQVSLFTNNPGDYRVVSDFGCYRYTIDYQVESLDCSCSMRFINPQPSDTNLDFVLTPDVNQIDLWVFTASGQLISHASSIQSISTLNLPAGIYFWQANLQCEPKDKRLQGKLVLLGN